MNARKNTRIVKAGSLAIGGDSPVSVQSMLNTPAHDIVASVAQAKRLECAGCDMLRAAIPDPEAVPLINSLKEAVKIPIVADIHFDYKLALESAAAGVDKIRINPGNIGDESRVKKVADACRLHGIPIRIGVNSGSLERDILAKYGHPTPEAMRDSVLYHVSLLEKYNFNDIVLSIKSSDVQTMVHAYELVSEVCDYPLHLGVTEAGTERMGMLKSAAGIGSLLLHGIGDTIRVSLTADPQHEVEAGIDLLRGLGIRSCGATMISCPTCGRTGINLIEIANEVERRLRDIKKPVTVAVMGCVVNGPGEAREADVGIAGGSGRVAIFKKGKVVRTVDESSAVEELIKEINSL
ncbi:MAG TPA: 4-hydroxy-3-methylbut-2-en-1-yl diphosphate synthase [Ruminococcaceae bacterium]|nr:4-hydroxy-3-methylbut-2-en-1-yl diphosphate synthase [Oscillospiraceae bacterium]